MAIIVDHRVRPESTEESQTVKEWLERIGVPAKIYTLKWDGDQFEKSATKKQFMCREKRYEIFQRAAREFGIRYFFMGHHLQDSVC